MADKTADLLIEIICEEIPARMQAQAASDLARLFAKALKAANAPVICSKLDGPAIGIAEDTGWQLVVPFWIRIFPPALLVFVFFPPSRGTDLYQALASCGKFLFSHSSSVFLRRSLVLRLRPPVQRFSSFVYLPGVAPLLLCGFGYFRLFLQSSSRMARQIVCLLFFSS